jgi:hypothetical protein
MEEEKMLWKYGVLDMWKRHLMSQCTELVEWQADIEK